uniref:Granulins domain-containing protein n=1 Tax=Periophthalmus magnuspinnatus TaxID=409849 RepID=A0A3B4A2S0_9GOBI
SHRSQRPDEEEEDDKEEDDEEGRVHCSNQHACPRNSTCCRLGHRRWGCCPLPKAVCCTDHQHCCPAGYQCDLAQQMCVQSSVSTPFTTTQNSPTPTPTPTPTPAPQCEDKSSCPDHNTCCQLASGEYGCCPLENVRTLRTHLVF